MSALGIDLGSTSIKLVGLSKSGGNVVVDSLGIIANPVGVSLPASRDQTIGLAEAVKKLVGESKTKETKVRLSLAESAAYTRIISMPAMSRAELASAVNWEAEEHIPVPLSQVQMDWSVISPPKDKSGQVRVLLVAARKDAVDKSVSLITQTGLELVGIETVLISVVRALVKPEDEPTLILHLGASSSDFAITVAGEARLVHSSSIAGAALTRALSQTLNMVLPQAESYKRAYGLDPKPLGGKVRQAILPVFKAIIAEARKVINSFESGSGDVKVRRAVLSGGGALLPEIISAVSSELSITEAEAAAPFAGMKTAENVKIGTEQAVYSCAVGLAKSQL